MTASLPDETNPDQRSRDERWQLAAACTAGILAMLAGIISLLGEQQANLAILHQIRATSQWAQYQGKSIRKNILQSRLETTRELGKQPTTDLLARMAEYDREKNELSAEAWGSQNETQQDIRRHDTYSVGLTLFHIAIALSTLALIARRRIFWFASILFGITGCAQILIGLLSR
jgi:hypothetical protein